MNRFVILIFIVFSASCSTQPIGSKDYATVDILDQEYEEKVEVDPKVADSTLEYGPQMDSESETQVNKSTKSQKVLGLTFYPAGYLSIGYIGVLKKLEQVDVRPHMLVCSELAALVCVLYAKYRDLNRVEWEIFNFYSKLKAEPFYSSSWRKLFAELLEKEFKNERLEALPLLVGVPVKISDDKVKVFSKGKIQSLLNLNLKISGGYPLSVITEKHINYDKYFQNRGADEVFGAAIVPSNKILESGDGYLFGLYSKLVYSTKENLNEQNMLIKLDQTVDSKNDILGVVNTTFDKAELLAQAVLDSITIER